MEIRRRELEGVLGANQDVLKAARDLIELTKEMPALKDKLQPVIDKLVTSGTFVNTVVADVAGIVRHVRGK